MPGGGDGRTVRWLRAMTPLETIDHELAKITARWRAALTEANYDRALRWADEINDLLDRRLLLRNTSGPAC